MAIEIGIPLYNGRKTLDTTLSSIVMQTERKRILVTICDDCSTDDCKDIIDKYRDLLNINIIHTQKNGGAGIARNEIIKNARGDFLMFLDADDSLYSPLAIKVILHKAYREFPDIMYCKFVQESDGAVIDMDINNCTWVHGKVWKTSFLQKSKAFFPPIRFNEDSAFCTLTRNLTSNIVVLDFPVYCWINNKESTVRKGKDYYSEGILDFLEGRIYVYRELMAREEKEKAQKDFIFNLPNIFFMYVDFFHGAPQVVNQFNEKLGNLLQEINYLELVSFGDVQKLMIENYLKHKFNPRYGLYVPHIGMFDYFNAVASKLPIVNININREIDES